MKLRIETELRDLCRQIIANVDEHGEVALIESDDEYQIEHYCGGWAALGDKGPGFYFSWYSPDGGDYIFYLSLADVRAIAGGQTVDPSIERWKDSPIGPY